MKPLALKKIIKKFFLKNLFSTARYCRFRSVGTAFYGGNPKLQTTRFLVFTKNDFSRARRDFLKNPSRWGLALFSGRSLTSISTGGNLSSEKEEKKVGVKKKKKIRYNFVIRPQKKISIFFPERQKNCLSDGVFRIEKALRYRKWEQMQKTPQNVGIDSLVVKSMCPKHHNSSYLTKPSVISEDKIISM